MPLISHSKANQSVHGARGRAVDMTHSPDGYFANEEAFLRAWLPHPLQDLKERERSAVRSRSRTHTGGTSTRAATPDLCASDDEDSEVVSATLSGDSHTWQRPRKSDSRGPCPALNTLANHGFLPRDGRDIGPWQLIKAMRAGYGASLPFAAALTLVSYAILRFWGVGNGWAHPRIDLADLAAHNVLEHDGSLAHADVSDGEEEEEQTPSQAPTFPFTSIPVPAFLLTLLALALSILSHFVSLPSFITRKHRRAPSRPSPAHIRALFADSASGTHFTPWDAARARLRASKTAPISSPLLRSFAEGEYAMALDILAPVPKAGDYPRLDLAVLEDWLLHNRLPANWKPTHVQGLWQTHLSAERVRNAIRGFEKYGVKSREVRGVVYH